MSADLGRMSISILHQARMNSNCLMSKVDMPDGGGFMVAHGRSRAAEVGQLTQRKVPRRMMVVVGSTTTINGMMGNAMLILGANIRDEGSGIVMQSLSK